MSSLKSMMAAKKAQHRITAPHAKYSNSAQLSCSLCGLAIKHESLWGAHVQSKVCSSKLSLATLTRHRKLTR